MIKILFICHGNICRSPMAEFVCRDMADKAGLGGDLVIASAATSTEEIGSPVHPGTRRKLGELGISCAGKRAVQVRREDYDRYNYLIVMDALNLRNLGRIIPADPAGKIRKLLDFTGRGGDIADPWYTGNFDDTLRDIQEGCQGLIRHICASDPAVGQLSV